MTPVIEEIEITETDIELFMESFCCTREYAIRLLETEAKSKIEYLEYLAGVIDPRDQNYVN